MRVDVSAWLSQHAVTAPFRERECWESPVGVPPEPGLICITQLHRGSRAKERTVARVWQQRDGRLERVWEGIVALAGNAVDLLPNIAPDGRTLVLAEAIPQQCWRSQLENGEKLLVNDEALSFSRLLDEACQELGTYVWSTTGYIKQRDAIR